MEKMKKLESRLKSAAWKNPVAIEYTARDTLQQNSPVEVDFYALTNKAHATMHHMNLPMEMEYQLFGEIFTDIITGKLVTAVIHFVNKTGF